MVEEKFYRCYRVCLSRNGSVLCFILLSTGCSVYGVCHEESAKNSPGLYTALSPGDLKHASSPLHVKLT